MTETEASRITVMIAARYPTPALPAESQELWARMIEDLDYDMTVAVIEKWMRAENQRPDPADVRRLVAEAQAPSDCFLPPAEAWGKVTHAISRVGRYRPFPGRGLLAEAVATIGWETICDSDNLDAIRAHFFRVYGELLTRAQRQSAENTGAFPQIARRDDTVKKISHG